MSTEIIFNTVTIRPADLQEQFPYLATMMDSYLPAKETPKRRKRRKKKTVSYLINEIIESIEAK